MNEVMVLKEIEQTKQTVAKQKCYSVGRIRKDGTPELGLAFSYYNVEGKKCRKNMTGGNSDDLHKRAAAFLDALCKQKLEVLKKVQTIELEPTANIRTGVQPCDKNMREVMDMYLASYLPSVGYSQGNTQKYYRDIICKKMGDDKLVDFDFEKFQKLLNELLYMDDGVNKRAKKSIEEIRKFLENVLKYAWKMKWMTHEDLERATSGLKCPEGAAEYDKGKKFFKYEEVGKVLYCLKDNRKYQILAKIAVLTGMRGQELFALEKKDLVREAHYINVRQALNQQDRSETGRAYAVGKTKTKSSIRKVPATDTVFRLFDRLEEIMDSPVGRETESPRQKAIRNGHGEFIWVDRNGNLVDMHAMARNFSNCLKKHSKEYFSDGNRWENITTHCFRHCYITYMSELNAEYRDVQRSVGHSMETNVTDIYYNSDKSSHIRNILPYIEMLEKNIEDGYAKACEEAVAVEKKKNMLSLW